MAYDYLDPYENLNRERVATLRRTPAQYSAQGGGAGVPGGDSGLGWKANLPQDPGYPLGYGLRAPTRVPATTQQTNAGARSSDLARAMGIDYLGGTPASVRSPRPTDSGPTDEDLEIARERAYQDQLSRNDPAALQRRAYIGQQRINAVQQGAYAASPQGRADAFRDRLNSGAAGPTAQGGDPRLTDPYGLRRAY